MGSAEAKWKFHKTLDVVPRSNAIVVCLLLVGSKDLQSSKSIDHSIYLPSLIG